jgi:hypothetical protein
MFSVDLEEGRNALVSKYEDVESRYDGAVDDTMENNLAMRKMNCMDREP